MVKAVAVITVSDTCFKDNSKDSSGPALADFIKDLFPEANLHTIIIPDEKEIIERELKYFSETNLDLVLTTGGTGLSCRDVTPEATKAVIHREVPAISVAITLESLKKTPMAMLSRSIAGIRDKTLIINFPGSKKAVVECFEVVKPVLAHALSLIHNDLSEVSKKAVVECFEVVKPVLAHALSLVHNDLSEVSKKAVVECFEVVKPVLAHALSLIHNDLSEVRSIHDSMQYTPTHVCHHHSSVDISKVALRPRESPFPMLEMTDAWELVDTVMQQWIGSYEIVTLEEGQGRVVGQTLLAKEPMPPFTASVKDGYACISNDGAGIRRVRAALTAGEAPTAPLNMGECARINTGAALPAGADCVVQVEDTKLIKASDDESTELEVEILVPPKPEQDVRPVGFDISMGAKLVEKGDLLDAAIVGVLAGAGYQNVTVKSCPKVALLSTGNELQEPSEVKLRPAHIRDSNRTMLKALLREYGYDSIDCGIARDSPSELVAGISSALARADILLCTGGVSMGERDLLKPVLVKDFNATLHFGRVRMKPGKPSTFATCEYEGRKKFIFALPGNPVSAYVCCLLFVIRALRISCGRRGSWPRMRVRLAHAATLDVRPEYARAKLTIADTDDMPTATLIGNQCSSRLLSACGASVLLELPGAKEGLQRLPAGATVSALITGRLDLST